MRATPSFRNPFCRVQTDILSLSVTGSLPPGVAHMRQNILPKRIRPSRPSIVVRRAGVLTGTPMVTTRIADDGRRFAATATQGVTGSGITRFTRCHLLGNTGSSVPATVQLGLLRVAQHQTATPFRYGLTCPSSIWRSRANPTAASRWNSTCQRVPFEFPVAD